MFSVGVFVHLTLYFVSLCVLFGFRLSLHFGRALEGRNSVVATVTDSVWSSVDLSGWQGIVRKLEFRRLLAESVKTPDRLVYDCEFTQQSGPI